MATCACVVRPFPTQPCAPVGLPSPDHDKTHPELGSLEVHAKVLDNVGVFAHAENVDFAIDFDNLFVDQVDHLDGDHLARPNVSPLSPRARV
jgi:hypothetical protein